MPYLLLSPINKVTISIMENISTKPKRASIKEAPKIN